MGFPPDDGNPLTREVINCVGGGIFGGSVQCERETITLTQQQYEMGQAFESAYTQIAPWLLVVFLVCLAVRTCMFLRKGL